MSGSVISKSMQHWSKALVPLADEGHKDRLKGGHNALKLAMSAKALLTNCKVRMA